MARFVAGQPVVVFAAQSAFRGEHGVVTAFDGSVWVRLDGQEKPIPFGTAEVIPAESSRDVAAITNE